MRYTKQEAVERLREELPEGSKLYTVFRHASDSNMTAHYQVVTFDPETGRTWYHGYNVATATGHGYNTKHEGVTVRGCGFDRAGSIVEALGYALYGNTRAFTHFTI